MDKALLGLMAFYYFYIVVLGVTMFLVRFKAVKAKRMRGRYFKSYQGEIPDEIAVFGNHFNNQFQLPMVFLITCVVGLLFKSVSVIFFALALSFVVSRLIHTWVHLGSNVVLARAGVYFFGAFCLLGMWTYLVLSILF